MNHNLPHDTIPGTTIGFIADTHVRMDDGSDLPDEVLHAFQGVDLIVHLGDMGHIGVLDRLATVAPVLATRNVRADPQGEDTRIAELNRIVEMNGVRIGSTFEIADGLANRPPPGVMPPFEGSVHDLAHSLFGGPVDVIAFGGTHADLQEQRDGVLFFNPGSPTLSATRPRGDLGTVAILDVSGPAPSVRIVSLERQTG
jgi:hypothetical protein